jgi:acyl-CoA thioester hydrolase
LTILSQFLKQKIKNVTYITKPIRVRYSDTDQMGYMHHSNYLRFFEIARLEWMASLEISYKQMEKNGIWLPVVSAEVYYKTPSYFDDELTIKVKLEERPMASLHFSYEIHNQHQKLVCTGLTKLAFLDAKLQRPVRCPKNLFEALKPYF